MVTEWVGELSVCMACYRLIVLFQPRTRCQASTIRVLSQISVSHCLQDMGDEFSGDVRIIVKIVTYNDDVCPGCQGHDRGLGQTVVIGYGSHLHIICYDRA